MTLLLSDQRTARFESGGAEIDHPVDELGRMRFRAKIDSSAVEFRSGEDNSIGFKGTAIVFNSRTWIGSRDYGYWEQIAPEAVTKTLQEADVRFLINHDPNLLLARNKANTLRLAALESGLGVDADMAPVSYAQDLAVSLQRGDINQMSFAFTPVAWARSEAEDGKTLITFTEIRLWDVSVVTYPAYEQTDAGLRSAAFEALCRSQGLDPVEFLRQFNEGTALDEIDASPEPATTTRDAEAEPEPPAETTAPVAERDTHPNPGDRLRELRHADLARTL